MPATLEVNIQLTLDQLVRAINQLDNDELENLLVLLDQDLVQTLIERREQAQSELKAGTLLTAEEIFEGLD